MTQIYRTCYFGLNAVNMDDKPHHCRYCPRRFAKYSQLRLHMCSHYGIKPFFCNICKKGFDKQYKYQEHIRSHTGETPYSCKICNRRYRRMRYAHRHVCIHLFKPRYPCSECKNMYYRKERLNRHLRVAHKLPARHLCCVCDSVFKNKAEYDEHTLLHSNTRFYLCKLCRKQFSSLKNRNIHVCIPIKK